MSGPGESILWEQIPGDLNQDGLVDMEDLQNVIEAMSAASDPLDDPWVDAASGRTALSRGDANGDGVTDENDLMVTLENFDRNRFKFLFPSMQGLDDTGREAARAGQGGCPACDICVCACFLHFPGTDFHCCCGVDVVCGACPAGEPFCCNGGVDPNPGDDDDDDGGGCTNGNCILSMPCDFMRLNGAAVTLNATYTASGAANPCGDQWKVVYPSRVRVRRNGVWIGSGVLQNFPIGSLTVEGVNVSNACDDVTITFTVMDGGIVECTASTNATVYDFDVDVDSDNDGTGLGVRMHDSLDTSIPGQLVPLASGDSDSDGVPDWADGMQRWTDPADPLRFVTSGASLTPMLVYVRPKCFEMKLTFNYFFESDPSFAGLGPPLESSTAPADFSTIARPPGRTRLWSTDIDGSRHWQPLSTATPPGNGTFIPSGSTYAATLIGDFVYIEGINPGSDIFDIDLTFTGATCSDGDLVFVTVVGEPTCNLTIDSNNDGFVTDADDAVEDVERKIFYVNNDDDDEDDYLDYLDIDGTIDEDDLIPIRLEVDSQGAAAAAWSLFYNEENEVANIWSLVNYAGTATTKSFNGVVHYFIPPTTLNVPFSGAQTMVFQVEGIQSGSFDPILTVSSAGVQTDSDVVHGDVADVDLDIDSDNTDGQGIPVDNLDVETLEDNAFHDGKYLAVNRDNDDDPTNYLDSATVYERIDDFADGYNLDGLSTNSVVTDDDLNDAEDDFVPVVLRIPDVIDLTNATIKFEYDGSDPLAVTFTDTDSVAMTLVRRNITLPPPGGSFQGAIRLWSKPGNLARDGKVIQDGVDGDYVAPNVDYIPADLGITDTNCEIVLYAEGIHPKRWLKIKVLLDLDGPLGPVIPTEDEVTTTVVDVQFLENSPISGFDHSINPRGLMVPLDEMGVGTNTVKLRVDGHRVLLRSVDPLIATVAVGPYETFDNNQPVGVHEITVSGTGIGNTLLEAYIETADDFVVGRLRVLTLPPKHVMTRVYLVTDSAVPPNTTTLTANDFLIGSTQASLDIWQPQANVTFGQVSGSPVSITYGDDLGLVVQGVEDLDNDGNCEAMGSDGWRLSSERSTAGAMYHLFAVWQAETDCPPDEIVSDDTVLAYTYQLDVEFYTIIEPDSDLNRFGNTLAHELGHGCAGLVA